MSLKKLQQKYKKYKYKQYDWQLDDPPITDQDLSDDQDFSLDKYDLENQPSRYVSCYACCQVYASTLIKKKHIHFGANGRVVLCPFCKNETVIGDLVPKDQLLKINRFLIVPK